MDDVDQDLLDVLHQSAHDLVRLLRPEDLRPKLEDKLLVLEKGVHYGLGSLAVHFLYLNNKN
jgi:hypothetical protein